MTRVKPTQADYLKWVKEILATGRNLTDWEKGFCRDMQGLLEIRGFINDEQARKLEQIYATRTPL